MPWRLRLLPDDPDLGWLPYVWVLYAGFVFLTPVLGEIDTPEVWRATTIATAAFLPLFFLAYWVSAHRQLAVAVAMALVGAALAPHNPGASTFFAYGAYFAGLSYEHHRSFQAIGLIFVLALITAATLAPTVFFTAPALLGVAVLGPLGSHYRQSRTQVAQLRMARAEIEALARIAERDRIAGDLHDLLGQTLSLIVLKSELTQALVARDATRAAREAGEITQVARQALTEVRDAVRGYRVGGRDGLQKELEGATNALKAAGVELTVKGELESLAGRLDAVQEGVLALALREATTNIMRHARATSCRVTFIDNGPSYGLEIHDNGRGHGGTMGFGLRGMKQRIESLGGHMDLKAGRTGTSLGLVFQDNDDDADTRESAA